ncbi:MAG: hypothetical protein QXF76_02785 [Candidatus Anstonellales archaeon]
MSCSLTKNFTLGCKEYAGGISEIKVKAFPITDSDFTIGAGNNVTIATGSQTGWFKYEFRKEVASLVSTATANPQNATLFYNSDLKFSLENFDASDSAELHSLLKARVLVAIKTNAGKYFLLGLFNGADTTSVVAQTGTAFGDRFGYEVTINYKDITPIYEIDANTYNALS